MPRKLIQICDYLISTNVQLSSQHSDGRINSIANEGEILKSIDQKFHIDRPQARDWADFYIGTTPVNIKITTTKTADNVSSKKGLYYALTGEIYTGNGQWDNYLCLLKQNLKNTDKDYYFLVINKQNNSDIFINSLKNITTLQPNGNNPPFQIKWDDNRTPQPKNWVETKQLLLGTLGKSLKLRADAHVSFQQYFNRYL